ncbi:MAG: DNA gyrase subunit A [Alphaproteobacteria bacterium]|nr:DNA gyrase subunit A [Alphaproteobacteria bacterium]
MTKIDEVIPVTIEEELKRSYLDYAMSVIVSRALPDVRDGLKPVQRRILYAMGEDGFEFSKPHKKSARVVGQVIYKYHPHGTDPIYGALVRLAQNFAMRACLIDGHGNFGSMDGDKAAAMRYTEVRLTALAEFLLKDYDKDTVDFQPNYDNSFEIPGVLPARFPNLLVNGASGIAVGMATNIPSHNLGEIMDACCALIDQPDIEDLSAYIKGPDFPTGGVILGKGGFREGYRTGRGSFIIRGRVQFEDIKKDRQAIVITEVPYQVNKADMVQRIAQLVNAKELEGISDLRDESDRHGVRVVIELKRDAIPEIVLNRLYAMTALQTSFGMNMLALNKGRPIQMSLLDILRAFLSFRREVVTRRTHFFLKKARERAHILMGLSIAVRFIDPVMEMIRASSDASSALRTLMGHVWSLDPELHYYLKEWGEDSDAAGYSLSEEQGKAILALRLQRLTGMERGKLDEELRTCHAEVLSLLELLGSHDTMSALIKQEFAEIKERFSTPRLTTIEEDTSLLTDEDLIQCEDMVVTVTLKGYIKRVPLSTYRSQKRGGRGRTAMDTRDEDEVSEVFVADTHTILLFFTSLGKAYQLKVHELPLGSTTARGKPLISLFPLEQGEALATLLPLPKDTTVCPYIIFATSLGHVRKNALGDFLDIRANGKIAMKLGDSERLIAVSLAGANQDVLLSSHHGKSIRFATSDLRQFSGRTSTGVRGILLKDRDAVVSMSLIDSHGYTQSQIESYRHKIQSIEGEELSALPLAGASLTAEMVTEMQEQEQFLLSISERGFGKRTSAYAYRCANRGGQGVATMDVTERTGLIVNALPVKENDHILLLTEQGQLLRCPVADIRISGRKTQGVKLFRLEKHERIVSVAIFPGDPEAELVEKSDASAGAIAQDTAAVPSDPTAGHFHYEEESLPDSPIDSNDDAEEDF